MSEKKMMLGNAAIARGAWEAGVKVSSAYPGTPSTEISEEFVKYPGVYAEWAPNEKVAAEVAIGASFAGVRSLACMKMVGLNVAADPLYSVSYIGADGGLVFVVADDPGLYSSQNEQDTRRVCRAAVVPCLEPADSQEAKDFVKYAYEISEKFDTPVIIRTTTRLAHSQCEVELCDRVEPADKEYKRDPAKRVMMPGMAKKRHLVVEQRMKDMEEWACSQPFNKVEMGDMTIDGKKVGFITGGIPYQYVKEVCPDASILKLGMCNPLPKKLIQDFAKLFTIQGEYSANMIRERVLGQDLGIEPTPEIPPRPPILCPGCPHRATYTVLKKLKIHAAGDIGCYTLGALPPLAVVDTTVCMGSSISSLHGMEKAKGHDYIKNWVAVIGDSTFMHTGLNSVNMYYNQSHGTVIILDNRTTGMTGHQDHPGTGKTLTGETVPAVHFPTLIKGIGIQNVHVVNPFDIDEFTKVVKEETQKDELSVIIAQAPCACSPAAPLSQRVKTAASALTPPCATAAACA